MFVHEMFVHEGTVGQYLVVFQGQTDRAEH